MDVNSSKNCMFRLNKPQAVIFSKSLPQDRIKGPYITLAFLGMIIRNYNIMESWIFYFKKAYFFFSSEVINDTKLYIILKYFSYFHAFMQQKKHFMYLINDIYEAKNTAILVFISARYPE